MAESLLEIILNTLDKPTYHEVNSYHFTDYWIRTGLV